MATLETTKSAETAHSTWFYQMTTQQSCSWSTMGEMSAFCSRILLDESVHHLINTCRLSASTVDKLVPVWCPHPIRSASCPRLMANSPIHHEMYRTSINGLGEWVSYIEEPLSSLPYRKANCSHRNNLDIANAQSDVKTSPSSCLPDSFDRLTPT